MIFKKFKNPREFYSKIWHWAVSQRDTKEELL